MDMEQVCTKFADMDPATNFRGAIALVTYLIARNASSHHTMYLWIE